MRTDSFQTSQTSEVSETSEVFPEEVFPEQVRSEQMIEAARLLVSRLERISADSVWAHRSSGLRGELLRWIERIEASAELLPVEQADELDRLQALLRTGFWMLEMAARELSGERRR